MENLKEMLKERNEMLDPFNVQIYVEEERKGFFSVFVCEDDGMNEVIALEHIKEKNLGKAINDAHVHFLAWFTEKIKENFSKLGSSSQVGLITELFNSMTRKQEDEFLAGIENDLYRYFMMQGKLIR